VAGENGEIGQGPTPPVIALLSIDSVLFAQHHFLCFLFFVFAFANTPDRSTQLPRSVVFTTNERTLQKDTILRNWTRLFIVIGNSSPTPDALLLYSVRDGRSVGH
jgi:hypothetical protein